MRYKIQFFFIYRTNAQMREEACQGFPSQSRHKTRIPHVNKQNHVKRKMSQPLTHVCYQKAGLLRPMPHADQNHGIDPKCLSMPIIANMPINSSQLIRIDRHWDQCQNFDIDRHWKLIGGVLKRRHQ